MVRRTYVLSNLYSLFAGQLHAVFGLRKLCLVHTLHMYIVGVNGLTLLAGRNCQYFRDLICQLCHSPK